jgi:hypothetical protein
VRPSAANADWRLVDLVEVHAVDLDSDILSLRRHISGAYQKQAGHYGKT